MKRHFLVALVLFGAAAWPLAAQSVSYSFDKEADFSKCKTYKWVKVSNGQQLDELTADQLTATLDVELAKRGLKKSSSNEADLYIGYQIASGKEKPSSNSNIGLTYGAGQGGDSAAATATTTVHSGQLILDMYNSTTKKLVWRGVISHSIDADAKPDKKQRHMDKAVEKLLNGYPPKKK